MPQITGDQVVGTGSVCAFQEDIVVGVRRDGQCAGARDEITVAPDELEQLQSQTFSYVQLGAGKHLRILVENGLGHIQPARPGRCQGECSALEAFGL